MGIKVGVLTISDRTFKGERKDESGPLIRKIVEEIEGDVVFYEVIPDEEERIKEKLIHLTEVVKVDLILTTGGTGLGPRDNTPEATREVLEKEVPGINEAMRLKTLDKTPRAMLSRGCAGIRGCTLIVNLPGSPRGVRECLEVILPALPHAIEVIKGKANE